MRLIHKTSLQSVSVSVRLRPSNNLSSPAGYAVLQVTIDRKTERIPLKIVWPLENFDKASGELQPRHKNDQECDDNNLIIRREIAKANDICIEARLAGNTLTHKAFRYRYENVGSGISFADYMEKCAKERLDTGEIKKATWKLHQTNVGRWQRFNEQAKQSINFTDLNEGIIRRFRLWLEENECLEHNTITGAIKITKIYLARALRENYRLDPSALKISSNYHPARKTALNKQEVAVLKAQLNSGRLSVFEKECLVKFLFMIYTGLRISDANRLQSRNIKGGELEITQLKTRGSSGKKVKLQVPDYALDLIKGRTGLIFAPVIDQSFNRTIKQIAHEAGITKCISAHIARYTFATWLYQRSGNIKAVSDLLGHTSIRTTEIYLQIDDDERASTMKYLNEL